MNFKIFAAASLAVGRVTPAGIAKPRSLPSGDDWQAIYRFSGAQLSLTTAFNHYFGEGDCCALDTTYRFNGRIGEIANGFIQQNPHQLSKPLNSLMAGDKKAVTLLADDKLDDLLDKLSGYVKPGAAHPAACPLSPSEA